MALFLIWNPTNASFTSLVKNKVELSWLTKDLVLSLTRSSNTIIGTTSQGVEVEIPFLWNSSDQIYNWTVRTSICNAQESMRLT